MIMELPYKPNAESRHRTAIMTIKTDTTFLNTGTVLSLLLAQYAKEAMIIMMTICKILMVMALGFSS